MDVRIGLSWREGIGWEVAARGLCSTAPCPVEVVLSRDPQRSLLGALLFTTSLTDRDDGMGCRLSTLLMALS